MVMTESLVSMIVGKHLQAGLAAKSCFGLLDDYHRRDWSSKSSFSSQKNLFKEYLFLCTKGQKIGVLTDPTPALHRHQTGTVNTGTRVHITLLWSYNCFSRSYNAYAARLRHLWLDGTQMR